MSRVFITGVGVVSPIGTGAEEFFCGLHAAKKGIDRISCFDTEFYPTTHGAEARKNGCVIAAKQTPDRKHIFAEMATAELAASGTIDKYEHEQKLLCLGAGIDHFDLLKYAKHGKNESWMTYTSRAHATAKNIAEKHNIRGGHFVNVSACVASSQAMGLALRILKNASGEGKAVITGGFDSMLSPLHYMGFFSLGALSQWDGQPSDACRPFDRDRRGLVIGEGAAMLLFEREDAASKKDILCEIAGYASTMDAYMITDPDPSGRMLAIAMLSAIREAGITPDDIDAVDMHGTGTIKNAQAETKAMGIVFPTRYREVPVFALKGQIGHLIGACGAMETLGVIDMIRNQRILPSVNCEEPDPEVPLRIIRDKALSTRIEYVLKINAAFGGQNTAIVFRRYHG